jgi:ATP-dependent helicase/DNAse subunit B
MPEEMLLFYQVVTRARRRLVLSYPAVDERGQALLPSSFLAAVHACFAPNAVPVVRRNMLIERYEQDEPLSPAEYRVRVAKSWAAAPAADQGRAGPLAAGSPDLAAAAAMVRQRFDVRDFTPYDGHFRDPAAIAEVGRLFGPEKVISPTALEGYIACPFQFFLRQVLRLEPLEEPREEIESTRRGQAFHRALSRLHTQLRAAEIHGPSEMVDPQVLARLEEAVLEDVARAPSPASKELWRLEGRRLLRSAARYRGHWQKFVDPWHEVRVLPRPVYFEVEFGAPPQPGAEAVGPLVLQADGVEVRVGGRIDRIDVAELEDGVGFWIIDYKTGHSSHYTAADLRVFRRLQLTLYALAVERVFLAGKPARPLGLTYWLVTDSGPKPVLPGGGKQLTQWLQQPDHWPQVREQLERWVTTLVDHIRRGAFPLKPRSELCTQTCDYGQVCRINQCRSVVDEKTWQLPLPVIP